MSKWPRVDRGEGSGIVPPSEDLFETGAARLRHSSRSAIGLRDACGGTGTCGVWRHPCRSTLYQ
jgi:hypothetical protein